MSRARPRPAAYTKGELFVLKGFKDFLLRGNVIDLAIAVVIGAAFGALVSAFGTAFLQPLIGLFLGGGVEGGTFAIDGQIFDVGLFLSAVLTFVITAAVIYFFVVMPVQHLLERRKTKEEPEVQATTEDIALLQEIRDLLRDQRRPPV